MRRAETVEKAHGRIETRRIAVRPIPSRLDHVWPGATRIVRLERLRELKDRCSRQIVHAITSIPPEALDAAGLLALARAHWQIENRLFRVREAPSPRTHAASAPATHPQRSPICAMQASPSSATKAQAKTRPRGFRSKSKGCYQSRYQSVN
jgi:hypothetical protein